ncbi:DinB family protein [Ammoniphilus resinae]|uniref:Damage-inducible protein DinB n=1 Tax=Ammoniphilus resinae TaxID=861532 RepID=A0ABS4GUA4_9BACL|nr:DinB family protein [Ammoniphilus resinae]MBP1933844.1 putative damage-inducible protein DinB [Ammoniphilus resinae]
MLQVPNQDEYQEYYEPYVKVIPEGDLIQILKSQLSEMKILIDNLTEEQALFRYAPEKWSIKEVLGHVTDTERIMSYRLLRIGRGDTTDLAGFDDQLYVRNANFNQQSLSNLLQYFEATRHSTIAVMSTLSNEAWLRRGTANQTEVSARALAYIIAGHERHHRQVIHDKYLAALR